MSVCCPKREETLFFFPFRVSLRASSLYIPNFEATTSVGNCYMWLSNRDMNGAWKRGCEWETSWGTRWLHLQRMNLDLFTVRIEWHHPLIKQAQIAGLITINRGTRTRFIFSEIKFFMFLLQGATVSIVLFTSWGFITGKKKKQEKTLHTSFIFA